MEDHVMKRVLNRLPVLQLLEVTRGEGVNALPILFFLNLANPAKAELQTTAPPPNLHPSPPPLQLLQWKSLESPIWSEVG